MTNEITVQRSGKMHDPLNGIRPFVTFKVKDHGDDIFEIKSGRKLVMQIEFDLADDSNYVAIKPWFGGMFWVEATTIEDAVSEGMEYFRCFITGNGEFNKG